MIKLCVRSLPSSTTEENLSELFSTYGTVRSIKLIKDIFTGQAKGLAFIEMEGHEARAAIAGLDGTQFNGRTIYVSREKARQGRRR